MEKKLVKEINIKVNSNQKKIRGSIFLNNPQLPNFYYKVHQS